MIELIVIFLVILGVCTPLIAGFAASEFLFDDAIWPIVVGFILSLALFGWCVKQSQDAERHNCDVAGGKLIHTGYQNTGKSVLPVYECVIIVDHTDELTTPLVRTK